MDNIWNESFEEKLQELIIGNDEKQRKKIAEKWKQSGNKIMGVLCTYVPREIIYAAGFLPWRLTGTWDENTPLSTTYRTRFTCRYCSHVLEGLLNGEIDYLDGILTTNRDDDFKRLWDVIDYLKLVEFNHIIHLPHTDSNLALEAWKQSVVGLANTLEEAFGISITTEKITNSIAVYNRQRNLIKQLYELRKAERPPLSGTEMLGITTASLIMPPEEFNEKLEQIIPHIAKRQLNISRTPRILVSSDMLDDPRYIKAIEDCGAIVVMDDMDTGSRSIFFEIPNSGSADIGSIYNSIANSYMTIRPSCPRMWDWDNQTEKVMELVKEYNVQAVIDLPPLYSFPREFFSPYLRKRLQESNIPVATIRREYQFANAGQLSTRFGALVEMLG